MNIKIELQEIDYNTIAEALYPSLKKMRVLQINFFQGYFGY